MQYHGMQDMLLRYCQVLSDGVHIDPDTALHVAVEYLSRQDAQRGSPVACMICCSDTAKCLQMVCTLILTLHCKLLLHI